jgi:Holliday junction DNA helicase RuvA
MIEFVSGIIEEKNPAFVVINCNGTGYLLQVSLNTFGKLPGVGMPAKILVHQVIREDAHLLFGFVSNEERAIFRHLISVSGVGPNTARMVLSSLPPDDVITAIATNNPSLLQTIKGIGAKSAQRIVVDLRDKIDKMDFSKEKGFEISNNTTHEEALSALVMLGFARNMAQKAVFNIVKNNQGKAITSEFIIKEALKSF